MSHLQTHKKVYYYVLEGSQYLFADERDKKHLLDAVREVQRQDDWLIYAFCVMDDSAYFVIEAVGMAGVSQKLQKTVQRLFVFSVCKRRAGGDCRITEQTKELGTLSEIAGYCRQIHRIPLEEGYVRRIGDYWWSSYPTYTGNYEWAQVDCRLLLMYFSADPDTARKKLRRFHLSIPDPLQ